MKTVFASALLFGLASALFIFAQQKPANAEQELLGSSGATISNKPSSQVTLKSDNSRALEVINQCECDIVRFQLGCISREGRLTHSFPVQDTIIRHHESLVTIAQDADIEELSTCQRLSSSLTPIQVWAGDGGRWSLSSKE